jgi:broad specificity polyphosphatase/5'/3'-nucleotidase SurE
LIPILLQPDLSEGSWVNVNFPDVELGSADDILFVEPELDRNPLPADYLKLDDGKLLYNSVYNDRVRTPGHDADVCFSGNVSITFH